MWGGEVRDVGGEGVELVCGGREGVELVCGVCVVREWSWCLWR